MKHLLTVLAFAGSAFLLTPVTDDFNRADSGTLGSDWQAVTGIGPEFAIVSNQAASTAGMTYGLSYYKVASHAFGPVQSSETVVTSAPGFVEYGGVVVLTSGTSSANVEGYMFQCNDAAGAVVRFDHDLTTPAVVHNYSTAGICANTNTIKLTVDVSGNFEVFINGSTIGSGGTDTTYTTGQPGIGTYSAAGAMTYSTWTGDSSGGATSFIPAIINSPVRGGGRVTVRHF